MKKIYTVKDIQHFLYEHGISWDGVKKNEQAFDDMVLADVKIFNRKGDQDVEVYLDIDELTFKIFIEVYDKVYYKSLIKDFSFDWAKKLLKKNPTCVFDLKNIIEKKMKIIQDSAESIIQPMQEKIKEIKKQAELDLKPLKNIEKLIINSLLENEKDGNDFEIIK